MSDSLGRPFSPNEIENSLKFNLLSSSAVFCVRCFCPPLMMSVFTVSTSEPMSPSRRLQHCNARRKLDRCSLNRLTCAYICSLGCQFTGSASASSRDKGTVLAGHQTLDTLCFQRVQTTWLVKAQAHDQAITWKQGKKMYLWWICLLFVWPPQKKKKKKDIQGASTSTPGHRGIAGVTVSTFQVASPPQCLEQQGDVHLLCVPFVQG